MLVFSFTSAKGKNKLFLELFFLVETSIFIQSNSRVFFRFLFAFIDLLFFFYKPIRFSRVFVDLNFKIFSI